MENDFGLGSDRFSEHRYAVHRICHVPRLSSFSTPSLINATLKRDVARCLYFTGEEEGINFQLWNLTLYTIIDFLALL